MSGSEFTPIPGHGQTTSITIVRLDSTRALLVWADGNDVKYEAVDCSGASPVLSGVTHTISLTAAPNFTEGYGHPGYFVNVSDGNVLACWLKGFAGQQFAVLSV